MHAGPAAKPKLSNTTKPDHFRRAQKVRRTRRLKEFVKRIRKRAPEPTLANTHFRQRPRRYKRKAVLAASAALVGISSSAMSIEPSEDTEITAPLLERQPATAFSASLDLMEAIAAEEGVHLIVYRDAAGNPTVGVGHLVTPEDGLSVGDQITHTQAIGFLEQDLRHAERIVGQMTGDLPLFQHEFDALVDLVFNVGEGTASAAKSPALHAAIAAGDYHAMAQELAYHSAGNGELSGLVYRSERRKGIFLEAEYADPRPADRALASASLA